MICENMGGRGRWLNETIFMEWSSINCESHSGSPWLSSDWYARTRCDSKTNEKWVWKAHFQRQERERNVIDAKRYILELHGKCPKLLFLFPHLHTSPLAISSSHILCDMSTWFVEVIRWKMRYKLRRRTRSRATMCEKTKRSNEKMKKTNF